MSLYLITTGIGEYAAETKRRAHSTDDPDMAKRFITEDDALNWGMKHLGDRHFWVHECEMSFVRLPT